MTLNSSVGEIKEAVARFTLCAAPTFTHGKHIDLFMNDRKLAGVTTDLVAEHVTEAVLSEWKLKLQEAVDNLVEKALEVNDS